MQYNVYLFKRFNLWLSIGYNFRRLPYLWDLDVK